MSRKVLKSDERTRLFLNLKAETLAEVIIALTMMSIMSVAITKMIVLGFFATSEGEERLRAYNLAREGVELVRNLRDTNWLRFPVNYPDCWDTWDVVNENDCKVTLNKLADGKTYSIGVEVQETTELMSLNIIDITNNPTENPGDELYTISVGGIDFYTNDSDGLPTIYRRFIKIKKIKDGDSDVENILHVTCTVIWEWKGQEKKISFTDRMQNK